MLKIKATQDTDHGWDSGMVETTEVVGFFPVNEDLPAFQPQRTRLVEGSMLRDPSTNEAWVSHDGKGGVSGFPIEPLWAEECANPEAYFEENGDEFQYEPPSSCESYISV